MDRRHNDPQTPHERARELASDRLHAPIAPADALWLDEHLAGCEACRSIATAYAENRELLRSLATPEPPRDLWARTSVALERERGRSGPGGRRSRPWFRWETLVGVVAILVIGVIVGRSLLVSTGAPEVGVASPAPGHTGAPASAGLPGATPLAVPPGTIAWARPSGDGSYTVNIANVAAVCPADAAPAADCAPIDADAKTIVSLPSRPGSILLAPQTGQAAVVDSSASTTGGSIIVVPLAGEAPAPTSKPSPPASSAPPASISPTPSATPSATPEASSSPTPTPSASVGPTATAEPSPSSRPSPSASATPSPSPSATASEAATASASPVASPTSEPSATPAPTLAAKLAIIDHVIVVGGEPSYSPDDQWLAFSARPADGSHGPDVYVWHLGDRAARPLTTDHGSVFADWVDGMVVASRAITAPAPAASAGSQPPAGARPISVRLDPVTGAQQGEVLDGIWRPVVDPSGRWVVYWAGTLGYDASAAAFVPAQGRLVIADWHAITGETPAATPDPQPLLEAKGDDAVRVWEVRWDPTGAHVGAWIADPLAAGLGRLSLVAIDPSTGRVDTSAKPVLRDAPALPGFAIGDGRIAWATPPGQDGEGSTLRVLAWKGPDSGQIKSDPAASDIVVAH